MQRQGEEEIVRTEDHLSRVFSRLERDLEALPGDRPKCPRCARLVGINGIDTAGKTSFARKLEQYLKDRGHKTQLIHLDDFHNPKARRAEGSDPVDAYITNAFDLERLVSELIESSRAGAAVACEIDVLNLETDDYTNRRRYDIGRDCIILLEGVLLYREPLDQYFDYRVLLDITFEELLSRAETRDVPLYGPAFLDRYHNKYIPIQKWYLAECQPREKSDLVIDNNDYHRPVVVER